MVHIKIITLTILILVLLSNSVLSTQVKFMHPDINQSRVNDYISTIEPELLEGIPSIKFYYGMNKDWCGLYYKSGLILIDYACHWQDALNHELKHHFCYSRYMDWNDQINHQGCFTDITMGLGRY